MSATLQWKSTPHGGMYSFQEINGGPLTVSYIQDKNGLRISSHKLNPRDEQFLVGKIKPHITLLEKHEKEMNQFNNKNDRLKEKFKELSRKMNQFSQLFLRGTNKPLQKRMRSLSRRMEQHGQQKKQHNQQMRQYNKYNRELNPQLYHHSEEVKKALISIFGGSNRATNDF